MIDTPGFDDSKKSETDVLREIAGWLTYAHSQGVRLDGMVYLQGISEPRMKGSQITNLRMFKKMTGLHNMKSVVFATTMWDKTPPEDGKKREQELLNTDAFWGELIQHGSRVKRFKNDRTSALDIIGVIVEAHEKFVPSLQQEMAVDKKKLDETDAGKTLNIELTMAKERFARDLKEQESELRDALREKDTAYAQQVMDIQDKLHKEMERLAKNQQDLQVTNDRLLKDKEEEIKRAREEMDQMRKNVEERDKRHAGEVAKLQEANKTVEETMKLEIAKSREKFETDLQAYQEELVGGAVTLVREMDSYYQSLSAQQRQNMEEQIAKMKANAGPPPPYSASQYPRPIYVQQGPSADEMFGVSMKQAATAGAIGATAVGGLMSAAATAVACIVM